MNASPRARRSAARRLSQDDAVLASKLASTCRAAETILGLAAERARDASVAVAARSAAAFVARIRVDAGGRPQLALHDRLRIEWLASSFLPGRADARLLDEAARLLHETVSTLPASEVFGAAVDRLRLASAEAWSLAHALTPAAEPDLLFATG